MPDSEIKSKTKLIIDKLTGLDEFVYAKNVYCYIASRKGEVDTRTLITFMEGWGKTIMLPKLNKTSRSFRKAYFTGWDDIVKNNEGYWEPAIAVDEDLSDVDLMIIPALAVSIHGQRVGYGGGYYDKLLKTTFSPRIVLAFEFQIFEYIESSVHDIRVDKIITERRVINTRKSKFGF
jgi:5-formyltetrahydrofolate cyclo-ligase